MKKRISPALVTALVMFAVTIAAAAFYLVDRYMPNNKEADLAEYLHLANEEDVGLVVDGEVSEQPAKRLQGELYLPCDAVREMVDPGLYYDAADHLLILTKPTEVETVPADGTDAAFCLKNEVPYVSAAFVRDYCMADMRVYGTELPSGGSSDATVGDSTGKEAEDSVDANAGGSVGENAENATQEKLPYVSFRTADAYMEAAVETDEAVLREEGSIKAPVLAKLSKGEKVRVLSEKAEDGFWKVVAESGLSGYVENGTLSEQKEVRRELPNAREYTHHLKEGKVVLAFHQVTDQASNDALPSYIKEVVGVTDLAPTWFFLDSEEGAVTSLADAKYVKRAHKKGLGVYAVFNDFDGTVRSGRATADALSSFTRRQKMIQTVTDSVLSVDADGICLDFENVTPLSAPDYIEFLRELSAICRKEGLVLSVCNYPPTYTKYYDRKRQAEVVDYIICMCYDEHTKGSAKAGSVASLPFVESGIAETLQEVPAEQLIAALPFYTRIWESRDGVVTDCKTAGMANAAAYVEERGLTLTRDEAAGQDYAVLKEGTNATEVWLENGYSLGEKLGLAGKYDLGGVAVWKLGFETADIWTLFLEYLEGK